MPFTPTHVAAALPVWGWVRGREGVPAAALVVGTMIPDAAVFLPGWFDYRTAHSLPGLFTRGLPLGLAAWLLWEFLLKGPLLDLAPDAVRRRLPGAGAPAVLSVRTLAWAAGLVLAGAASHVAWDAFTHAGRWGVRLFPVLDEVWLTAPSWVPTRDRHVRGFRVAQYGSTALFLPLTVLYAAVRLRGTEPVDVPPPRLSPAVRRAVAAGLVLVPLLVAGAGLVRDVPRTFARLFLLRAVVRTGLTVAVLVLGYAVVYRVAARRVPPRG